MVAAIVLCGLGYAEGAALSRRLGGWQVISWALLLALPLMVPVAIVTWPPTWSGVGVPAWIGLAYVSVFSMFVGFIFWYRGLASRRHRRASASCNCCSRSSASRSPASCCTSPLPG